MGDGTASHAAVHADGGAASSAVAASVADGGAASSAAAREEEEGADWGRPRSPSPFTDESPSPRGDDDKDPGPTGIDQQGFLELAPTVWFFGTRVDEAALVQAAQAAVAGMQARGIDISLRTVLAHVRQMRAPALPRLGSAPAARGVPGHAAPQVCIQGSSRGARGSAGARRPLTAGEGRLGVPAFWTPA